ncbi:haloacid dehalogenase-like hydrolase [Pseudonocardia petroleophila]|uniref:Haloacid dehalogenase-like hydrolase n=1 Tax=Pseudonocardia petroleophila TaxID=37331 RepID=A0A7G7MD87_9PSEU|nr:haloacid dehalogenase-like hydrolase [Pseudonocardia petroleophila]QNG50748.1 haloacid dehalogenase-like hydrolase [Pseudonocardia petroleophila]
MRLIQWDVDRTLLVGGGVGVEAYAAAFTAVTGIPWRGALVAAGRTDLSITPELFAQHGIDDAGPHLEPFFARYAEEFAGRAGRMAVEGRLLPGAAAVLAALAGRTDVVQTLVTGNIAPVGVGKVAAFGLDAHLDTAVGGYGDDHPVRAELVRRSRERAEAAHGPFADADVLVVGDTVHDVGAALAAGVVAVGVATGPASVAELTAAGAHHVLDDLSDVEHVVAVLAG